MCVLSIIYFNKTDDIQRWKNKKEELSWKQKCILKWRTLVWCSVNTAAVVRMFCCFQTEGFWNFSKSPDPKRKTTINKSTTMCACKF